MGGLPGSWKNICPETVIDMNISDSPNISDIPNMPDIYKNNSPSKSDVTSLQVTNKKWVLITLLSIVSVAIIAYIIYKLDKKICELNRKLNESDTKTRQISSETLLALMNDVDDDDDDFEQEEIQDVPKIEILEDVRQLGERMSPMDLLFHKNNDEKVCEVDGNASTETLHNGSFMMKNLQIQKTNDNESRNDNLQTTEVQTFDEPPNQIEPMEPHNSDEHSEANDAILFRGLNNFVEGMGEEKTEFTEVLDVIEDILPTEAENPVETMDSAEYIKPMDTETEPDDVNNLLADIIDLDEDDGDELVITFSDKPKRKYNKKKPKVET